MKNWNYIEGAKTGNIKDDAKAKELHKKMMDAKEIAEEWGRASNYQKKDNLEGGRKAAEDAYRKAKKEYEDYAMNSKTGNETLHEYATSKPRVINEEKTGIEPFFKKLAKDGEEREKKDDADIEKVGNSKWELPDGSTATVEDDGTIKIKKPRDSSIYITKLWDKERAEKQLAQKGAKKVGNQSPQERLNQDLSIIKEECRKKGISLSFSELAKELEKYGWDFNELRKLKLPVSVGNAKVGNATPNYRYKDFLITNPEGHEYIVFLKDGRTVGYRGTTSKAQAEDWCDWHDPKTGKSIGNKVGNRVIEKESEMSQELKNLLKKAPEWIKEKIEYAFSHGFTIDEKDFITAIKKEVGNSKTGNATYTESDRKRLYELAKKRNKTAQEWAEFDELNRREEQASRELIKKIGKPKTGNSASDDKFAYVMREFDVGKLKTPDGKVVTDPAQAKAIAYSESKKTENGLDRARKAMNAWNSERKIEPVGKYREFIDNLKNAIELGAAGVLYNSLDEQTVKEWVEKAKKEGYGSHISGVQGKKVILK